MDEDLRDLHAFLLSPQACTDAPDKGSKRAAEDEGGPPAKKQKVANTTALKRTGTIVLEEEAEEAEKKRQPQWFSPPKRVPTRTSSIASASNLEELEAADAAAAAADDKTDVTEDQMAEILSLYVPNIDELTDRTGEYFVSELMWMTHTNGLPLYRSLPAVQEHTKNALRHIFRFLRAKKCSAGTAADYARRLADAFTACQAEQGRVIDAVYGEVVGRDKGLLEQVLAVVDAEKQSVLDLVTHALNPDSWRASDDDPSLQVPHIQSAYRRAVGGTLGLRGVAAASADWAAPFLPPPVVEEVLRLFRENFKVSNVIDTLVKDVNRSDEEAKKAGGVRLIDRAVLAKWAGDAVVNNGFDSHSIFYDESRASEYSSTPADEFQVFLSPRVTADLLRCLLLK